MKIALIAPNPTFQTEDLRKEAENRGHSFERIKLGEIDITDPENDETIKRLLQYDIIYFRNGADRISKMILGKTLSQKGKVFINSGYYTKPLLSDKIFQVNTVSNAGINTPRTITLKESNKDSYQRMVDRLGSPFILKPSTGAKGIEVNLIKSKEDLENIRKKRTFKMLLQEFIPNDGDFRVLVINHKAIDTYKRIPPKGDFRANISQGGHGENVTDKKLRGSLYEFAEKITPLLDLEIAGIDIIKSESNNKLYFIESNSIPQWEGFKHTTKINFTGKILDYFESRI